MIPRRGPSGPHPASARSTGLPGGGPSGLGARLLDLIPWALVLVLAASTEGRQPGEQQQTFRPNALQSFPLPAAPAVPTSSFSATLAATTRFFASFSSTSFSETTSQVACVPGEAGTWPIPGTNCNMFYRCGGGRRPLEFRTCPPGKVYYAEYQDCQYPTASWRCWEPICTGRVDGTYPDWSTNCRRSVRCQGGHVTAAIGCPNGQLSAGRNGCRPAHEVSCPRVSEGSAPVHLSPQRPSNPVTAPGPAHPLCFGRAGTLVQDRSPSSRCRQYFRCSATGQRSVETCPGLQVFDGARCVEPEYYSCSVDGETSSGPCDRLPDGAYPQPGSRCRAYYRCALGFKSVFVCSGDSVFDGERCVPNGLCAEDTGIASLMPQLSQQLSQLQQQLQQQLRLQTAESSTCAGKSHGYFADTASSCRRYVYCLSGTPVGTFTCEGGRRFDGRLCADTDYCAGFPVAAPPAPAAPTQQFQQHFQHFQHFQQQQQQHLQQPRPRPQPQQNQQQSPQQGFFADLSSGCRNYSFFIAGHETKLSCPPGLLFNGQLCVSENTYNCPTG